MDSISTKQPKPQLSTAINLPHNHNPPTQQNLPNIFD